ncbi:MAG: LPS assembly protein LptD [Syntrophorhabdaceae bacterium]|nr:LPS assembly protein LptD [Syntrophorhabdaceae bacterium]
MKRRYSFFVVLVAVLLFFALCATAAFAESGLLQSALPKGAGSKPGDESAFPLNAPVNIDADNLFYDEENGIALAEGNVEVTLGTRKMRADRISYNFRTGEADLTGQVRYKDADEQFSFDRVTLNLNAETGVLYNGSILIGTSGYQISGERIEKTGEQSFLLHKGSITTCPCDPTPDWDFGIRRASVVIDGYAVSKDVTIRAKGIPVLWLPYAVLPVKLSRQSGFLLPSFSTSQSRGATLSIPYYWAINRWSDATVTTDLMEKRGVRPELEYRFVLNQDSEGTISGNFIQDKKSHHDRWRIQGRNTYHSGGWTANAQIEMPSDNQYYVDFAETKAHDSAQRTFMLRSARHTFSRGFVGWSGEEFSHQLGATWVEEMERYPADHTLHRLPEYQATLLPHRTSIGGIEMSGESMATYFFREVGDKAGRARGSATLSRTFVPLPSVSLTPYVSGYALGSHYEQYDEWNNTGRFIPVAGVKTAAEAQRSFLRNGSGFVHIVGVDVGYQHVNRVEQDNMPLHDRWSRIASQDQVVFTISQRLLRMKNAASPEEAASMTLEWAYDFDGKKSPGTPYVDPLSPFVRVLRDQIDIGHGRPVRTSKASDIYGRVAVKPFERWRFEGSALFDPADAMFSMAAISWGWEKDADQRLTLTYRITRELAEDIGTSFVWRPLRFLRLHANINYSLKNSGLTNSYAGFSLIPKSDCWSIGFTAVRSTYPSDTSYRLVFGLKGIGTVGEK